MLARLSLRLPRKLGKAADEEVEIGGKELETWRTNVVRPDINAKCVTETHDLDDDILESCRGSEERITVHVGQGQQRVTFMVHKVLLCRYSNYFKTALRNDNFREAKEGVFDFVEDDPDEFHRFVSWLYSCSGCKAYTPFSWQHKCPSKREVEEEAEWCRVESEHDYVLADRLLAPEYCLFTLGHFIQHVRDIPTDNLDRLRWVCENTLPGSSLHRFVRHWIAWLKSRPVADSVDPWAANSDLCGLVDGWATTDPRNYMMVHWNMSCCDTVQPECRHRKTKPERVACRPVPLGRRSEAVMRRQNARPPTKWERRLNYLEFAAMVWTLLFLLAVPYALVGLAAAVFVHDHARDLVADWIKIYSLATAPLSVIFGVLSCSWWTATVIPFLTVLALVLPGGVMALATAITCHQHANAGDNTAVCRMQAALGALEFFYVVTLLLGIKYWSGSKRSVSLGRT